MCENSVLWFILMNLISWALYKLLYIAYSNNKLGINSKLEYRVQQIYNSMLCVSMRSLTHKNWNLKFI